MSRTVEVALGERSYPIHIGEGLIDNLAGLIGAKSGMTVAIISNPTIEALYSVRTHASFERSDCRVIAVTIPDGEAHKTVETWSFIHDRLLSAKLDRTSTIVALGGGVVGDLAGFAAATYQRGIGLVQVPTTLLAQVDSSVGGKTGVNHARGKNMIGAFYQPRLVAIDTATLQTLPDRELRAGLAEVIKYGLIRDSKFFDWLEQNIQSLIDKDPAALAYAIEVSCRHKAEIVENDETEQGERALLNLGHTFGHAIEAGLGYGEWLHGEAVAAGTVLAARLSARLGWIADRDLGRIVALFQRAGLPIQAPALGADRYLELMSHDKKAVGGQVRLILVKAIGDAVVSSDAPVADLRAVLS